MRTYVKLCTLLRNPHPEKLIENHQVNGQIVRVDLSSLRKLLCRKTMLIYISSSINDIKYSKVMNPLQLDTTMYI